MAAAARRLQPVRRILIVDDEEHVCELIAAALEVAGFETHCIHTDRSAHAALSGALDYAALVVDVNLGPGVTGFDVARFARRLRPGLPVLYVSGEVAAHSFSAFGVPGSAFVQKPFCPDELVQRLHRVLAGGDG